MRLEFPAWPPQWPEIDVAVADSLRSGDWGRYRSESHRRLRERLAELFRPPIRTPIASPEGGLSADAPSVTSDHLPPNVRLCCSGTAAVELALRAAGVGPGDEVILAAYDYPGNFRCVELVGGRPVLVDVVPGGVTIDPAGLEAAAGDRVKAVIVSHLYGQPAAWGPIAEICKRHGWVTIEDACQVPGMTIDRHQAGLPHPTGSPYPAGSLGDLAAISFGGSKLLTAGSGGALMTKDSRIASRMNAWIDRPSDSYPLSPLQAAVLLPQIERLSEWNRRRRETVTFLQRNWGERLPDWTPVGPIQNGTFEGGPAWAESGREESGHESGLSRGDGESAEPAFYKFAWLAPSASHRRHLVSRAEQAGIPIGEGFRSMHRASERRCRRASSLRYAKAAGDRLCVLDHRALMLPADRHQRLLDALTRLHGFDETSRL